MKTIKTPPLETGGEKLSLNYKIKDFIQSVQGSTIDWQERRLKEFIRSLITHTTEQTTARETILELLSLMQAMPINERMGMPRHLVAIDLHKYAKSKGISLSEPLEKE
ncbi:hypothetical protein KBA63_00735 [Candidatus Woesebacteria bacterium]|nr:hypothetical protein [Candidatus Woesebacteria bacterium]